MNLINQKTIMLLCAATTVAVTATTQAQLPVSRAANVLPVPVAGASAATPVGVPFTQEPVARDVVSSSGGNTITGVNGGYPALPANTHIALIVTGPSRGTGLTITSNTANSVTVAGTVPALVSNSDEFEIVPLSTLASNFGGVATGGLIDLTGAGSAPAADKVLIGTTRYFYKTTGVNAPGWKLESAPNAAGDLGSTPISNLRGVNIVRVGAATNVGVRGLTRINRAGIPIPTGTTLLSWPYPGDVTLLNSGLQNTITGAGSAPAADKVIINGVRYFYKTTGVNAPGWKLESSPNAAQPGANNVVLNSTGKAFYILRLGGATQHNVLQPLN
jgi:hypothetical protein